MKFKLLAFSTILFLGNTLSFAQSWERTQISHSEIEAETLRQNYQQGQYYWTNYTSLVEQLNTAGDDYDSAILLQIPNAQGSETLTFKVWKSSCMEPALAAKYPGIQTFSGELINNRHITAKFDITHFGFHGMIYDGNETYFIEPINKVDFNLFGVFQKNKMVSSNVMECQFEDALHSSLSSEESIHLGQRSHGGQIKTYRLALACTYEYSVAVAGSSPTKPNVLSQMVTTLNRVNGVYERELAVHMNLVANTDTLIYLTSDDPYTNSSGSSMLSQNITTCNARIGSANYDIGHVFSTGGGGVAYLASVCGTYKGGGVTGLPSPFGDVFAIDYVAHEMGHQFGSNHTFNSSLNSCNGNGVSTMAFEPGSGSTIMAYAGICGADNIQSNSDAYFHTASLKAITININTGTSSTCPTVTSSPNTPNTLPAISTKNYTIPIHTPFELTAPTPVDATTDELLYCWEEWDLGGFGSSWSSTNNAMPFFKSFYPTTNPTRVFPQMSRILMGSYDYLGERLAKSARNLHFVLTTRDIYEGYGAFYSTDNLDTIKLTVVSIPDSFKVTSQNTPTEWEIGTSQEITWNVSGTASSPIFATHVDIYFSADSANSFPYLLAENVPNSGTATITIPSLPITTKGRIKVKARDNVFFQINRANITTMPAPLNTRDVEFNLEVNQDCVTEISIHCNKPEELEKIVIEKADVNLEFFSIQEFDKLNIKDKMYYQDLSNQDKTKHYRIKWITENGQIHYSESQKIINECNKNNIQLYPNPAKGDYIYINSDTKITSMLIYSIEGKLISSFQNENTNITQFSIQKLPIGSYYAVIMDENKNCQTIKFTKD